MLTVREENYYKLEYWKIRRGYERGEGLPDSPILDSSLISQTKLKNLGIKVIECGKYKSIYFYDDSKYVVDKNNERFDIVSENKMKNKRKIMAMFDDTNLETKKRVGEPTVQEIDLKNINRSKIEMQRLVKTNIDEFKTFITLTFDENKTDIDINNISECNKKFNIWKTYIRKLMKQQKKEFKYIGVPEFQKRGAVHYHLLTNIDYNDFELLCQDERKIWNKKSGWQIGRDVKGWKYGHNMAKNMDGINVVGYMSKYMTKDIDNRLFSKHRYMYSYNLKRPSEVYIDLNNKIDVLYLLKSLNNMEICYENKYYDKFNNQVIFQEYKIS